MKEKCLRPLLAVFVLLFAGMLAWNISLQREVEKYKPQVEAYLPEDVYVAVGSTIELYNDQVVWSGSGTVTPATGTARLAKTWRTVFLSPERKSR